MTIDSGFTLALLGMAHATAETAGTPCWVNLCRTIRLSGQKNPPSDTCRKGDFLAPDLSVSLLVDHRGRLRRLGIPNCVAERGSSNLFGSPYSLHRINQHFFDDCGGGGAQISACWIGICIYCLLGYLRPTPPPRGPRRPQDIAPDASIAAARAASHSAMDGGRRSKSTRRDRPSRASRGAPAPPPTA